MRRNLALYSVFVFVMLVLVSAWASTKVGVIASLESVLATPAAGDHPWAIATLFDAYFAFTWFWLWVAYRETTWAARLGWLVAIYALGNMAMAAYVLMALRGLPKDAGIEQVLLKRA